jgi:hypothetical protein
MRQLGQTPRPRQTTGQPTQVAMRGRISTDICDRVSLRRVAAAADNVTTGARDADNRHYKSSSAFRFRSSETTARVVREMKVTLPVTRPNMVSSARNLLNR